MPVSTRNARLRAEPSPISTNRSELRVHSAIAAFANLRPPAWTVDAPCQGYEDLFFPTSSGSAKKRGWSARSGVVQAQAMCHSCPLRARCIADALDYLGIPPSGPIPPQCGSLQGIWGGFILTNRPSAEVVHQMRAIAYGTPIPRQ